VLEEGMANTAIETLCACVNMPVPTGFITTNLYTSIGKVCEAAIVVAEHSIFDAHIMEHRMMREHFQEKGLDPAKLTVEVDIGGVVTMLCIVGGGYDYHWPKRASGRRYDSNAGTGFFCFALSRKIGFVDCRSNRCGKCKKGDAPQQHSGHCFRNHTNAKGENKSSKSMERSGAVGTVNGQPHYGSVMAALSMDDDSVTSAHLKKIGPQTPAEAREGLARVSLHLQTHAPIIKGDPSHRGRTFKNHAHKEMATWKPIMNETAPPDQKARGSWARHFAIAFMYAMYQTMETDIATMREAIINAGRHCCGDHSGCQKHGTVYPASHSLAGEDGWCKAHLLGHKQRILITGVTRCRQVLSLFIAMTDDKSLSEMLTWYGIIMQTQVNEASNKSDCKRLPKDRDYSSTNRHKGASHCTAAVLNYGSTAHADIQKQEGLVVGLHTREILLRQQRRKADEKVRSQDPAVKYKRKHKSELKSQITLALERQEVTYESGIRVTGRIEAAAAAAASASSASSASAMSVTLPGRQITKQIRARRPKVWKCPVCVSRDPVNAKPVACDEAGGLKNKHYRNCYASLTPTEKAAVAFPSPT